MADYRELLRRAVDALPENNGAARRQVYEKARSALVAQLRAIDPPLPAREITQHRLQLEDCIRQVEQQATDALLKGYKDLDQTVSVEETPDEAEQAEPEAPETPAEEPVETSPSESADEGDQAPAPEPVSEAEHGLEPQPDPEPNPTDSLIADPEAPEPGTADDLEPEAVAPDQPAAPEEPEPADETQALAESAVHDEVVALEEALKGQEEETSGPIAGEDDAAAEIEWPDEKFPETSDPTVHADESFPETPDPTVHADDTASTRSDTVVDFPGPGAQSPDPIGSIIDEADGEPPRRHGPKPGSIDYLIAQAQAAAERAATPMRWKTDSTTGNAAVAMDSAAEPEADVASEAQAEASPEDQTAMSRVREVDVDADAGAAAVDDGTAAADDGEGDPQGAIDRAIEALDREARGETTEPVSETPRGETAVTADSVVSGAAEEIEEPVTDRGGGNAVTIFLLVFLVLLIGAAGAGYWAWREGYVNLDTMFGNNPPEAAVADTSAQSSGSGDAEGTSGPGNTTATPDAVAPVDQNLGEGTATPPASETDGMNELEPVDDTDAGVSAPSGGETAGADTSDGSGDAASDQSDASKIEDRLPAEESFGGDEPAAAGETETADAAADSLASEEQQQAAGEAVAAVGAQSLLLESSSEGTTGAVPFSGTVDWSRGVDERGQPTIEAEANIPARNLSVDLLIRRNADPTLPASHLMEIDFSMSESFVGGSVASVPGVLLKNEELVQGTPLVGASARVVGNSFLFALSSSEQDVQSNINLLESRKWLDLALVYGTGNRAIITLEKDAEAEQMFSDVISTWRTASESAGAQSSDTSSGSEGDESGSE